MTVGTLFSGIGGFDLAASRVWGWSCIRWQCEIDPFCRRVLEKHWPGVRRYEDVKEIEAGELEPVDLILAAPPCQPVSAAGARKGKDDERWLWGEVFRIAGAIRPRWLVCENPPGLLGLGYDAVAALLESLGYEVATAGLPASALGANHQRERFFIIAHTTRFGLHGEAIEAGRGRSGSPDRCTEIPHSDRERRSRSGITTGFGPHPDQSGEEEIPDSSSTGFGIGQSQSECVAGSGGPSDAGATDEAAVSDLLRSRLPERSRSEGEWPHAAAPRGARWATEPGVGGAADGLSAWVDRVVREQWPLSWDVSLPALCGKLPNRPARIKALGNAIVPQVAELVLRAIAEVDSESL